MAPDGGRQLIGQLAGEIRRGVFAAQVGEGVQHDAPHVALVGQPLEVLQRLAERAAAVLDVGRLDPLREAVSQLNPDELSPRDALELLYRLKKL